MKLSIVHISAITLILLTPAMSYVYYLNTGDFNSPVIEFEFVTETVQVLDLFTNIQGPKKEIISGVNDQNKLDFIFMFNYSFLLILVFWKLKNYEKKIICNLALILSVLVFISDIFENIQLFAITKDLESGEGFDNNIMSLIFFTRMKWYLLSVIFALLSFHYFKQRVLGKILSLITISPLILTSLSIFNDNMEINLILSNTIMLSFLVLIIWIFLSVSISPNISFYKKEQKLKNYKL